MSTKKKVRKKHSSKAWKSRIPLLITGVLLAAAMLAVVAMNVNANKPYTMYTGNTIHYEKAAVTAVLSQSLQPAPDMPGWMLGSQRVQVVFKNGSMKGQVIELDNVLSATHNIRVKPGQSVVVKADRPDNAAPYYTIYNYNRTPGILAVAAVFVALMALVGRFKGLRSVLGLCISLFFVLAFLLPAIYSGHSPVLMSLITVTVISVFSLILLNGFSRKTLTAVAATIIGVVFSSLSFLLVSTMVHLFGYNISETEELIMISQHTGLQIGQVLFAGVVISCLGAVMDMNISIASSLFEMKALQPGLTPGELFRSGISIGQDMIGTMCQTLILAFVGSSLATLLVLVSYGTQFDQFMSSDFAAVEIVQGISGSMAVILAVPVTAGLCALFNKTPNKQARSLKSHTESRTGM